MDGTEEDSDAVGNYKAEMQQSTI